MPEEKKTVLCPSCQQPAIREGNDIICENCDATFKITKTGGAKVKKLGEIEEIKNRLDLIEARFPGQEPEEDQDESDKDEDRNQGEW